MRRKASCAKLKNGSTRPASHVKTVFARAPFQKRNAVGCAGRGRLMPGTGIFGRTSTRSTCLMRRDRPPEPWHSFFRDIDKTFDQPIALQCIGGFAIAMLYGLPRPTGDVDFLSVVPAGEIGRLDALAGMGSALDRKHGVYVQHVGIVTVPENYEDRLIPIFPAAYRRVHLAGLEASRHLRGGAPSVSCAPCPAPR